MDRFRLRAHSFSMEGCFWGLDEGLIRCCLFVGFSFYLQYSLLVYFSIYFPLAFRPTFTILNFGLRTGPPKQEQTPRLETSGLIG